MRTKQARWILLAVLAAGCASADTTVAPRAPEHDMMAWQSIYDEWHDWLVEQEAWVAARPHITAAPGLGYVPPSKTDIAEEAVILAHRTGGGPCDSTYTRRLVNGTRKAC